VLGSTEQAPPKCQGTPPVGRRMQAAQSQGFRVPPHTPSDIVSPASTLWWALVRVWPCRKIHLYGESKKSTHDHQTHLPARTHQTDLVRIRADDGEYSLATGALAASQAP
jgi:hypothetical protein